MIAVKNLTRQYGTLTAVDSISFEIPKGQIVGLLGHNGAGKTTTLKMLTGYLDATAGAVLIDGVDIAQQPLEVQKKIGYLSEQSPLYPEMTVWQYLEYVATLRGITENQRPLAIQEAVRATDLGAKAESSIATLSKGYRQRVGVAQAIIHKPEILILDEPTNGLDPTQILSMRQLIQRLAQHSTVIISTHIMQEVEAICDRVIIILEGRIAVDSTMDELHKNANTVTLSLKEDISMIKDAITTLPGIENISPLSSENNINNFTIKISKPFEEVVPTVAKTVVDNGWGLYQLHSEHQNLETVFREVNRRTKGAAHV